MKGFLFFYPSDCYWMFPIVGNSTLPTPEEVNPHHFFKTLDLGKAGNAINGNV